MQSYFNQIADSVIVQASGEEVILLNCSGENSDFIRFNQGKIRQPGSVTQRTITLELINGLHHASDTIVMTGNEDVDQAAATASLNKLREQLPHTPEDPYLYYSTEVQNSVQVGVNKLPSATDAVDAIVASGEDRDMVGIFAQGEIFRGFANSLGQRNWYSTFSYNMNWCFYAQGDKAVQSNYAGYEWDQVLYEAKVVEALQQLDVLHRPAKTIDPGEYRVYFAPAALDEIVSMLCWNGFGVKAQKTKNTCLLKMLEGEATFDSSVTIRENTADGLTPNFTPAGFVKPDSVTLIERGEMKDALVSARSSKEYSLPVNSAGEGPQSLDIAAGDIPMDSVLSRLGQGVYANQLWYLNFSDLPACRITGMTRFATFWVENGEIVAPLNVMRFDETVLRGLGENLLGLTAEREFLADPGSYESRSVASKRLPGALVDNFRFTL